MFDIYDTSTYSEIPDAYIVINDEKLYKNSDKKDFVTFKDVTDMILNLERFFQKHDPNFKISKQGIDGFLYRLYLSNSETNIDKHHKQDWISDDIKAMVDSKGNPLSRERQGKIQVIRDSKFITLNSFSEEIKNKIKEIFLSCLEKKEPKYRIRQELFYNFASLNWDCYDFVDYELSIASTIAYIKDEIYNSKPDEKVYFKRFEMIGCCSKCKKLNNKIALWSEVPLDSNKTNDKFADYVIWDDRFSDKKSIIPLTWCCKSCRGTWIRHYPEFD